MVTKLGNHKSEPTEVGDSMSSLPALSPSHVFGSSFHFRIEPSPELARLKIDDKPYAVCNVKDVLDTCIPFIRMEMLIIEGILLPCIDVDSGSKDILPYCVSGIVLGIVLGIDNCLKCAVGHVHLYRVPRVFRSSHLVVVGRPNPFLDISGVVDALRLAVMALQFCDLVSLVIDICLRDKQALMVSRELWIAVTTVEQQVSGSFGCIWLEVYLTTSDVYLVDRSPTVSPLFL